jgi:hypothetical protein
MANKFSIEAVFKAVDRVTRPISKMQKNVGRFTKSMERGLRRANRALTKLTDKMKAGFRRGAIVLTAAVVGVGVAIKRVADRADALSKQAKIIDMPIDKLQEYQFVAEQSGVSSEALTKSLGILDKQVGQAKVGTGTLVTMLKKSNPQLLQQIIHAKNTADAFKLMNKAIRDTKDPADRAALAFAAYGRQGLALVNMAKLTDKQFNKLTEEAKKNGIITQAQATAAEAFNDQLNSLRHTIQGVMQDALLPLMPVLKTYLKMTQDWIFANKALIKTRIQDFIKLVGESIRFLAKNGKTIAIVTGAVIGLMVALRAFIVVMTAVNLVLALNPVGLVVIAIAALGAAIALIIVKWKAFTREAKASPFGAVIDAVMMLISGFKLLVAGFKSVGAVFSHIASSIIDKIRAVINFIKRIAHPFSGGAKPSPQQQPQAQPQIVSPFARTAAAISERNLTQKSEVTIKDDTGRAQVTKGKLGNGLSLIPSGVF